MFKKTVLAAAIATVSATAMADVSISGQVKATLTDTDGGNTAMGYDNSLTFKASEDLGNGMSAFATLALDNDAGVGSKDQLAGLKGSFGTIIAGSIETLTEGKVGSLFDMGGARSGIESSLFNATDGRNNTIAYVSPTVNGFHVAIAGVVDNNNDETFTSRDILVAYDNGPLSIKVSDLDVDETTGVALKEVTAIAASYTMGDAKVTVGRVEDDVANEEDTMMRLDYKMGNNTISIGTLDDDTANKDVNVYKLNHALSNKTKAYVGMRDKDSGADQTFVGMITKF